VALIGGVVGKLGTAPRAGKKIYFKYQDYIKYEADNNFLSFEF
jgi:PDZ domain-containing secreted protein